MAFLGSLHQVDEVRSMFDKKTNIAAPVPQGYREMFAELRTAFSDFHVEVEHLTATDDDVAFATQLALIEG